MIDYAWCKFAKPKDQNKTNKTENVSTKVKKPLKKTQLKAKTPDELNKMIGEWNK